MLEKICTCYNLTLWGYGKSEEILFRIQKYEVPPSRLRGLSLTYLIPLDINVRLETEYQPLHNDPTDLPDSRFV